MATIYYQKKGYEKKHVKDIKIILKKKKTKDKQRLETDIKIFPKKRKRKKASVLS